MGEDDFLPPLNYSQFLRSLPGTALLGSSGNTRADHGTCKGRRKDEMDQCMLAGPDIEGHQANKVGII